MLRKIYLAMICLLGGAVGFVCTLFWLDRSSAVPVKAALTVIAEPGKVGAGATASLRPVAGGMELKSTFAVATAAANVDGAAYMSVDGPQFPLISGRHVTVELDATADVASDDQAAELQYVQNGLGQSGWKSFPVKPGRQTYRFAYAAPTDERTPSKVDTFWVRSDAAGRGRALIVHAVRLYIE